MTTTTTRDFRKAVTEHADELPCRRPDVDADDWFAQAGSRRAQRAQRLCADCPLYWACQGYAIDNGVPDGIWGGVDEPTRERIWKVNGKPTQFLDEMDAAIGPLLQERRDFENFDAHHPEPDSAEDEQAEYELQILDEELGVA